MATPSIEGWTCPVPLQRYATIVMGHGAGGKMMNDLIRHLFAADFENPLLGQLADAATIQLDGMRLAFTTDSFVVSPLFFPGGDIGELAVNGTINDLAATGAIPLYLSVGFILEEGLPMETLARISRSMAQASERAGVQIAAGDTKVVNKGHGDGIYINTSGIGLIAERVTVAPNLARPGDAILISGSIGDHGIAVMSVREGLKFETEIKSDTAPLSDMVQAIIEATSDIHCLRDATRGGLAAVLNELAEASQMGIEFEEARVPVRREVMAACELLGLDPLFIANEGKMVAIVPEEQADRALAAMRAHQYGRAATIIGHVVKDHPGMVVARTSVGGTRVVDLPAGELLPRIC
ncbi:MAG: hydrogenase expression/formation protein HypE [Chloroflexota bacterium]